MSAVQSTSYSFSLASSLSDVADRKCDSCGFSDWNIIPLDATVPCNNHIAKTACIFIAPDGSKLTIHLLELLLATNFGLTLNGRSITKKFEYTSPEKEPDLILHLINQDGFPYKMERGIRALMNRGSMTTFENFFSYFRGFDVCTVFPLIQKTSLDPFQQTTKNNPRLPFSEVSTSSSSSSSSPTANDVSLKGTYSFYIFSRQTIIFTTVVHLTNGASKALETPFPQRCLIDFLGERLPSGDYLLREESPTHPSIPDSLRFEDVEVISSTTDIQLDINNLSLNRTVTLNSGTDFITTIKHPIQKIFEDLSSYNSKSLLCEII